MIVDTSNEIAGDGDIPHSSIGRACRVQVPTPALQHEVMIEAVENHMPEVIIIDEIGRELEAIAARTIAERGVQLVGTAHGITLENLLMNPTLSDLVGGIESVTLSDEEARRRGTQKSVLERKAPPIFDVLIEIQDRQRVAIHHNVSKAVDALLRGWILTPELHYLDAGGQMRIEKTANGKGATPPMELTTNKQRKRRNRDAQSAGRTQNARPNGKVQPVLTNGSVREQTKQEGEQGVSQEDDTSDAQDSLKPVRIFPYGIGQNRLRAAAKNLNVPVDIVDDLNIADIIMTLKNYYHQQPQPITDAERRNAPIYIFRSNTTEF